MRSLIAFLTALLVIFAPTAAQSDTDAPRLRTPSVGEIIGAVSSLYDSEESLLFTQYEQNQRDTVADELLSRATANFDATAETYYYGYQFIYRKYGASYRLEQWVKFLINAWLREVQPDFNTQTIHNYQEFTITASPIDFNLDHQSEWVLAVDVEQGRYRQFMVAVGDIGALTLIPTDLRWFSNQSHYQHPAAGWMETVFFPDLTGDGRPEWVVAAAGWSYDGLSHGYLEVHQWHHDRLSRIAHFDYAADSFTFGNQILPQHVTFDYTDNDRDRAVEIELAFTDYDNWGCGLDRHLIYKWIPSLGDYRELSGSSGVYQDTPSCIIRNAHLAAWEGRHTDAIAGYERYFALQTYPTRPIYAEILAHARFKLALSYAMLGESKTATVILAKAQAELRAYDVPKNVIYNVVEAAAEAYGTDQNLFNLCVATYLIFETHYTDFPTQNKRYGVIEYGFSPTFSGYFQGADPRRAGCDAPAMIATVDPESPDTQIAIEILRAADEKYAYNRLLWGVRSLLWELFNQTPTELSDDISTLANCPAYLSSYNLSLKQRLDLIRADLEKFADNPEYGAVVRYHYAWALDDAGFFDDSDIAAAYQSVIDFAPDSPWAKLAALHVE